MYTVVLMAAMTTAPDVPDWRRCHCRSRCQCSGWCGGRCCGGGCCGGCCGGGCCHSGYCGGGSCGGCYGGGGSYGGGGYYGPGPGPGMPGKGGEPVPPPKKKGSEEVSAPAPAILIVNLPANARLTIDGQATQSTSSQRVFISPALEPGRDFVYSLRAEMMREDGQPTTATQQVVVRAGQETRVTMQAPATTVASSRN